MKLFLTCTFSSPPPPDLSSAALQLPMVLWGSSDHSIFCTVHMALFDASKFSFFFPLQEISWNVFWWPQHRLFSVLWVHLYFAFWTLLYYHLSDSEREGELVCAQSTNLNFLLLLNINIIASPLIFSYFQLFIGWGQPSLGLGHLLYLSSWGRLFSLLWDPLPSSILSTLSILHGVNTFCSLQFFFFILL